MAEKISQRINRMPKGFGTRELSALLLSVQADLASLQTSHNQLRTDFNAHVHGGITAGAANTAATTATTAAAVDLGTLP